MNKKKKLIFVSSSGSPFFIIIIIFFVIFLYLNQKIEAHEIKNPAAIKNYNSINEYYQDMKKIQKSYKSFKINVDIENKKLALYEPHTFYTNHKKVLHIYDNEKKSGSLCTPFKYYEWYDDKLDVGTCEYKIPALSCSSHDLFSYDINSNQNIFDFMNWLEEINLNNTAKFTGETDISNGLTCRIIDFSYDDNIQKTCISDKYGIALYVSSNRGNEIVKTLRVNNIEVNQIDKSVFKLPKKRYLSMMNPFTLVNGLEKSLMYADSSAHAKKEKEIEEKAKQNKKISKMDILMFYNPPVKKSKYQYRGSIHIQDNYDSVYEYYLDMKNVQRSYDSFKIKYRHLSENYINKEHFFYFKYPFILSDKISSKMLYKDGFITEFWNDGQSGYIIKSNKRYNAIEKIIGNFDEYKTLFEWYEYGNDYTPKFTGETKIYNNTSCRVIDFYNNKTDEDVEVCVSDKYGTAMYSKQKKYKNKNPYTRTDNDKILTEFTISIDKIETNNIDNSFFKLPQKLYNNFEEYIMK